MKKKCHYVFVIAVSITLSICLYSCKEKANNNDTSEDSESSTPINTNPSTYNDTQDQNNAIYSEDERNMETTDNNPPSQWYYGTITQSGHTVTFANKDDYDLYNTLLDYRNKCQNNMDEISNLHGNFCRVSDEWNEVYSDMQEGNNVSGNDLSWEIKRLKNAISKIHPVYEVQSSISDALNYVGKAVWETDDIYDADDTDDLEDCSNYMEQCADYCDDAKSTLDNLIQQINRNLAEIENRQ